MISARRNLNSCTAMAEPTITPLYPLAAPMQRHAGPEALPLDPVAVHIGAQLGTPAMFFHETTGGEMAIDIHVIAPTPAFPFVRLITSGMSRKPMTVPAGAPAYAELMMALPADWQLDAESIKQEQWYWPVALLRHLAHYPHEAGSWLGLGHSIPNGSPAKPYTDSVGFCGAIILPPVSAPEPFHMLTVDGKDVYFHCVVPLYQQELDVARLKGFPALLDKFNAHGVTDVAQPGRVNAAKRRKFLGLF